MPELLSPAGTLKNLTYALAYGADAVYAGMPRYSLRVRNNDFSTLEQLQRGIELTHQAGRRFYLATNLLPHAAKVKSFMEDIAPVVALAPDALIMADPGLIAMVRQRWPAMPIHLSVQANTMNSAAVRFWQDLGISRVILSRELSLDEIEEIRQECPTMELEVFVHGALCIAYSGRCLLSGYFNHRDANQGSCTNACRWDYKLHPGDTPPPAACGSGERHPESAATYLLEEEFRPKELMPIEEDEHGTYIMNSKDLRAIEHIERLVKMGINSLKIEGRTKSHYYVARATQLYHLAIADALAGRPFNPQLLGKLENLAHRGYTDGFFQRHHSHAYQNYLSNYSGSSRQQFVGEVSHYDTVSGLATIEVKNKIRLGDTLEVINPAGNDSITLEKMFDLHGMPMSEAPGGGYRIQIPLAAADHRATLLARELQEGEAAEQNDTLPA
ncbi:MAG: tRNA 5-hydroxyuridine modification protein YegQ [Gammaproteobacteria bacterium]|nr:tRNA 5-hydroxyuridine modification protein YegQ [Gammaproteobacteria bacterium]